MPRIMLLDAPIKTSLILMLLASAQAAPALSQEIIYGIEPGERVYRGERVYPGEPVYRPYREPVYGERELVPYEPGPLRHAPRPEVEIVSPEAVTQRLYQRGFRRLGPVEIDRGYYQLTAVDPAGNLIALSVSVVTGDVERSRILQARAAPPTIFSGPENRAARAPDPVPERSAQPSRSELSGPEPSRPEFSGPERAEAPASEDVARVDPRQPPPLPRPLPSRPMPVESVEETLTTASIPEAGDVEDPADEETAATTVPADDIAPGPEAVPAQAASSSGEAGPDEEEEGGVALSDFAGSDDDASTAGGSSGVRVIYPPTTATQVQPQGGDPSE